MCKRTVRCVVGIAMIGAGVMMAGGAGLALPKMPPVVQDAAAATQKMAAGKEAADQPSPRMGKNGEPDAGWLKRHDAYVQLAKKGGIDLYFIGDSITDGWHSGGKAVWAAEFGPWNPGNFGISGDRTQHVLWRLQNGELDGVSPRVFVMMIGTNNLGSDSVDKIVAGNVAIIKTLQEKDPQAKILLLAIFPRDEKPGTRNREKIKEINAGLAKLDDGKSVKFLDIGPKFLTDDGTLTKEIMPDSLHPNAKGYAIWAAAIKPVLTEWLGAPKPADAK